MAISRPLAKTIKSEASKRFRNWKKENPKIYKRMLSGQVEIKEDEIISQVCEKYGTTLADFYGSIQTKNFNL